MMKKRSIISQGVFLGLAVLLVSADAGAAVNKTHSKGVIDPSMFRRSEKKKTNVYVDNGVFIGGDRAINNVVIFDIKHGKQKGYERIVIDMDGNRDGELAAIERPPYFQVAVEPTMNKITVTLTGRPKLEFDSRRVVRRFKNSKLVKRVKLFPVLEKDRWTFDIQLKNEFPVEVFELTNPARLVVDVKNRLATTK